MQFVVKLNRKMGWKRKGDRGTLTAHNRFRDLHRFPAMLKALLRSTSAVMRFATNGGAVTGPSTAQQQNMFTANRFERPQSTSPQRSPAQPRASRTENVAQMSSLVGVTCKGFIERPRLSRQPRASPCSRPPPGSQH